MVVACQQSPAGQEAFEAGAAEEACAAKWHQQGLCCSVAGLRGVTGRSGCGHDLLAASPAICASQLLQCVVKSKHDLRQVNGRRRVRSSCLLCQHGGGDIATQFVGDRHRTKRSSDKSTEVEFDSSSVQRTRSIDCGSYRDVTRMLQARRYLIAMCSPDGGRWVKGEGERKRKAARSSCVSSLTFPVPLFRVLRSPARGAASSPCAMMLVPLSTIRSPIFQASGCYENRLLHAKDAGADGFGRAAQHGLRFDGD